uniref:Tetratricopeptide repeat protein n=1 Tax=candidate division WOR-3 bacterium TaxID=2052148 RepID=A0A7V0Z4Z1_UNCW3
MLITNKPNFIWSKCTNAQSYIVMLQKMGNVIWRKDTQDTMLVYPDNVAELSPGSYLLKIVATKSNDTIGSGERFIKILKPEAILEIDGLLKNIQKQNPDSFTLHFLSARIYEEKGLVFDAIREYEILLKMKPDEPLLHRSLSILYNKYGLIETGNRHLDCYEELSGNKK